MKSTSPRFRLGLMGLGLTAAAAATISAACPALAATVGVGLDAGRVAVSFTHSTHSAENVPRQVPRQPTTGRPLPRHN
jgi:hypothetical protein